MSEIRNPAPRVKLAFGLWVVAFALSLVLAVNTEPIGSGFTRGMNRIGTFFRWQFLSFALAIFAFVSARGQSELSRTLMWMSRVPIAIQCLLGAAGVVVVVLALVLR